MLKNLIVALFAVLAMSVPSMAADLFTLNGLNVQGDVFYLPSSGNFAVGVGTTIATIGDVVEIRGVFVDPLPDSNDNKAGLGIGVNLVKVLNMVGGTWLGNVNASVGVTALTNLSCDAHIQPAIYFTAISKQF